MTAGMDVELRTYVDILRRRSVWIKAVFLIVAGLGLAYSLLQEPVYRATALLEVRGGDGEIPSVERLFAEGGATAEDRLTHFGLLQSDALARRVIDDLRLDTLEAFRGDPQPPMQEMVDAFVSRIVVDPIEESRLVNVGFDARSAELSARIVNGMISAYQALRTEARQEAARRLAVQVDSVERQLARSESELLLFAREKGLPYLVEEDLNGRIESRLRDLRARLAEAESTRQESEALYQIVRGEGRLDILEDEVVSDLMLTLSELQREHARLSSTFTDAYPATAEVARQIDNVRELIREERERLAARVETDYRLSRTREATISEAIGEEEDFANEIGPETGRYHVLRQAVLANRRLLGTLDGRRREAQVAAAIGSTDLAVIDYASPPSEPHSPAFALNLALALMLGLTLGLGAALGREMLDDTVQSAENLAVATNVPVLALIPSLATDEGEFNGWLGTSGSGAPGILPWPSTVRRRRLAPTWPRIDTIPKGDPRGTALADAFGALRTALLFDGQYGRHRSLVVSSCRVGEGKTTVSINLAMSLARLGSRVLLIDADLRRPSVHSALRIKSGAGLFAVLAGSAPWHQEVCRSGVEGLDVLPAGRATTRAGDLLTASRLGPLVDEAESRYDFVVVDAPALFINAPDAKLLARHVDGVVVVLRSGSTPRALVERVPGVVPNVVGVVLNDLREDRMPDYFGDYFTGYGADVRRTDDAQASRAAPAAMSATDALSRFARWIQSELRGA